VTDKEKQQAEAALQRNGFVPVPRPDGLPPPPSYVASLWQHGQIPEVKVLFADADRTGFWTWEVSCIIKGAVAVDFIDAVQAVL
jgi:hypothetical protein